MSYIRPSESKTLELGVQKSVLREILGDPDICLTLKATALSQLYLHYVVPWMSK